MSIKPTYEELEKRNKELEKEAVKLKRLEVDFRENDEKFRKYKAYMDAMGDSLIVLNMQRKVIDLNKSAIQLLGYKEEEIPHLCFETIFPEKEHAKHYAEMKIALETGMVRPFETRLFTKDEEEVPVLISGTLLRDVRNEPIGFVGVCKDITARKQAEEVLQQRTHDLGERVKELNCLYGISNLVEKRDISLNEIFQGVVEIVPSSWQYSAITCSRIILESKEYRTKNFKKTSWGQVCDIKVNDQLSGKLEVYYLEEKPESHEGPFLKEERSLIGAIAERLGNIVEHRQAEEALKRIEWLLEARSENVDQIQ